ncbi:ER membrane protein complex subunit 4-like isoform X2 [Scyliorhinus canicula]|uniref:ER membrane protein complex subunit 4-like isoform X2 n=1 Tax=Scyliorhinus canicula TaxID=7830 RepID=UPI0018F652FE|nr:ER membrane protein complex subunit 4-like isoform X2 [Scyliorhinus canicula]
MAAGAALANRARRHKWALELNLSGGGSRGRDRQCGQGDSMYPVGYSEKQLPDTSVQETDRILVEKRCWDIALGPLKQVPMNLFIMYMAGNTISIFPIMMVCMMAWRPIQALMSMSAKSGVHGRGAGPVMPPLPSHRRERLPPPEDDQHRTEPAAILFTLELAHSG